MPSNFMKVAQEKLDVLQREKISDDQRRQAAVRLKPNPTNSKSEEESA